MRLYIDLENLKSLSSKMGDKEVEKLIREYCDIYYTFDQHDMELVKRQKIEKIKRWRSQLVEGRSGHFFYYNAEVPFIIDANDQIKLNDITLRNSVLLNSVFLQDATNIKPNSGLLIAGIGEELNCLRNLLIERKCISTKIYCIRDDVPQWNFVDRNVSPTTDIIINDLYLFEDSEIYYEINSYNLIQKLCSKSIDFKVNIVIITDDKHNCLRANTIIRDIKQQVYQITNIEPNVTIVINRSLKENERIHDRTIFTNYKLFISGDSLNYYKYAKKVGFSKTNKDVELSSHGMWFGVCSLFDKENRVIAEQFIDKVQLIISQAKKFEIFGDKCSNYLFI